MLESNLTLNSLPLCLLSFVDNDLHVSLARLQDNPSADRAHKMFLLHRASHRIAQLQEEMIEEQKEAGQRIILLFLGEHSCLPELGILVRLKIEPNL